MNDIKCNAKYCLFWTKKGCIKEKIELDNCGSCYEIQFMEISDEKMARIRCEVLIDSFINDEPTEG